MKLSLSKATNSGAKIPRPGYCKHDILIGFACAACGDVAGFQPPAPAIEPEVEAEYELDEECRHGRNLSICDECKTGSHVSRPQNLGRLEIRALRLSQLNPAAYNPRKISKKNREALSASLDEFGLVDPIIWNTTTGNIVGGHQRYFDLKKKGVLVTDCVIVNLSLEKEKKLNATLNNPHVQGSYTPDSLQDMLDSIGDQSDFETLNIDELIKSVGVDLSSEDEEDNKPRKHKEQSGLDEVSALKLNLTLDQHGYFIDTIRQVKKDRMLETTVEALIHILDHFNGVTSQ